MNNNYQENNLSKLQLSLYLMPILGTILALVNLLSKKEMNYQNKKISRLSLQMGLSWLILYSSLWLGSSVTNDLFSFRLLYLNGMITTGYFLICLFFILRIWNNKLAKK